MSTPTPILFIPALLSPEGINFLPPVRACSLLEAGCKAAQHVKMEDIESLYLVGITTCVPVPQQPECGISSIIVKDSDLTPSTGDAK